MKNTIMLLILALTVTGCASTSSVPSVAQPTEGRARLDSAAIEKVEEISSGKQKSRHGRSAMAREKILE